MNAMVKKMGFGFVLEVQTKDEIGRMKSLGCDLFAQKKEIMLQKSNRRVFNR
ncbi:hypothetical protein RHGRI_021698 [Rhododendron griersonianum]|uniref:Uncharacterized protein n=1 Tax=Rhododendron griersonianum TaxID=479676 RepID=A0AAV6JL57_9ERIC|nr:hypothetical protein RHGRI_021698 [Rhododendron griersonianum]